MQVVTVLEHVTNRTAGRAMTRAGHEDLGSRKKESQTTVIPIIDLLAANKKSRFMLGKIFGVVVSVYILMALALFSKPINSMDRMLAAQTKESRKPNEEFWYKVPPKQLVKQNLWWVNLAT